MHQPVSLAKPTPAPGEIDVWQLYDGPGEVMVYSVRAFLYLLCSPSTTKLHLEPINASDQDVRAKLTGPERQGENLKAGYRILREAVHDTELGLRHSEQVMLYRAIAERLDTKVMHNRTQLTRLVIALRLPKVL